MHIRRFHPRAEDGAVAITTAILLLALILMSAFIVDLGLLRVDHRDSQSVADMAVTAGALELGADINRVAACEDAWKFVVNNLSEVSNTEPEPAGNNCEDNFDLACDPARRDELRHTFPGTDIEVVIRMPVFDDDAPMQPARQTLVASRDGSACERISVELRRTRDHRLAVVGGFQQGSSTAWAVARRMQVGDEERYVSLIVLDRTGCSTIRTSGSNSSIEVQNVEAADGTLHPGTIAVDSAPTACGSNNKVFDVDSGRIFAEGDIYSYGLQENGDPAAIYDDVPPALEPLPQSGPIIRRTNMDHRYNCDANYGGGAEPFMPASTALDPTYRQDGVPPCDTGNPSYIRGLYAYVADQFDTLDVDGDGMIDEYLDDGVTARAEFTSDGFRVYPDPAVPTETCSDIAVDEALGSSNTRWFFDCPAGATVKSGNTLTIPDAELVVFRGDLKVSGTARFNVNTAVTTTGPSDATVVFWDGELSVPGDITTRKTFIYLVSVSDGRLTTEGTGGFDFDAPLGVGSCTVGAWPAAECFEDLAVWQGGEGTGPQDEMGLAGGGRMRTVGTVFAPNALINIGGGGTTDLESAQFFGWQFWYHGNGTLVLIPNPERGTPVKLFGAGLIR